MTPSAREKVLKEAKKRFERASEWEASSRDNGDADQRFAEGDSYNNYQWPDGVRTSRAGRPCLTSNVVRQHNLLIVNEARQNKASIKVSPVGGGATYEAAQVFAAMIRSIEAKSRAIDAYSTAIFHQVQRGIGYVRVRTDFADENSFDQDLLIDRISDPKTIYLDPDAKEFDKSDMRWAFVFVDTPRDEYELQNGDNVAPFVALESDGWIAKDHVREAEYWRVSDKDDTLLGLSDGHTVHESEVSRDQIEAAGLTIVREREVSRQSVEWFMIRGNDVIEEKEWSGRYIPIVPFLGEETVIDNVMDRRGHTRSMLDDQRMFNFWNSAAVEFVALQGKSPYVADVRAIDGLGEYWNNANTANYSVLPYKGVDDEGRDIQRPERATPPQMAQAYVDGMNIARERIREVSGQYQAEQGAPSNERSGVAITARQRQGDLATYHYIDNQAKGIRQVGRILLDMIPKVYDVERVVKILAEDGVTQSDVHINPKAPLAHQPVQVTPSGQIQPLTQDQHTQATNDEGSELDVRIIFNPGVGSYDVEADVGPNYGTQREEAFNALQQVIGNNEEMMRIAGDLLFNSGDFPGAAELAKRLKRGVPAQYLGGPSPELLQTQQQAAQMKQQAEHTIFALQTQVNQLQTELKSKDGKLTIDDYNAETARLAAVGSIDPASLQIIVRGMVQDMLGTPLVPALQAHAAVEQSTQPPKPPPASAA